MLYNTPKNELIGHFMRIKWRAVRNPKSNGHGQLGQFFSTKQAAQNKADKINKHLPKGESKYEAAPQPKGWGDDRFTLKYNRSWSWLMPVALYIRSMKVKWPGVCLNDAKEKVDELTIKNMSLNELYKRVYDFVYTYMNYKANGYK